MYSSEINRIKVLLSEAGIQFKKGMSENQIQQAQNFYNIIFPPDYKELLCEVLPEAEPFYDWTDFSPENIEKINRMLSWPLEGVLYDVEYNVFWLESWGEKPPDITEKIHIAKIQMERVNTNILT